MLNNIIDLTPKSSDEEKSELLNQFSRFYASNIKAALLLLRALNNPRTQTVMKTIHEGKGLRVNEIFKAIGITQSLASHQLTVLKVTGLVVVNNLAGNIFYRVN